MLFSALVFFVCCRGALLWKVGFHGQVDGHALTFSEAF